MTRGRDSEAVITLQHDRGISHAVNPSNDYRPTSNGNGYSNGTNRK